MQNYAIHMQNAMFSEFPLFVKMFLFWSKLWQERLLMIEEEGVAIEAGKMTIILKRQQQSKGFVKRTYQLSSKIPSSHHEVSLKLCTRRSFNLMHMRFKVSISLLYTVQLYVSMWICIRVDIMVNCIFECCIIKR